MNKVATSEKFISRLEKTMSLPSEISQFLDRHGLDEALWLSAECDWGELQAISDDHHSQFDSLRSASEFFAKEIQRFDKVHSVRWRVKDKEHLVAKIIRKRAEGSEKYLSISLENYTEVVTDLVGIRALHLFKEDSLEIDGALQRVWKPTETPVAYLRRGDPEEIAQHFKDRGFQTQDHPKGYRSVHYVISSRPLGRDILAEVQVRTIFEEGWSEIDHTIRYPTYSDNQLVGYFLAIFNRMAGSADEMGSFVRGLARTLSDADSKLAQAGIEKAKAIQQMEESVAELSKLKDNKADAQQQIAKLKGELERLKQVTGLYGGALDYETFEKLTRSTLDPSIFYNSPFDRSIFSDKSFDPMDLYGIRKPKKK